MRRSIRHFVVGLLCLAFVVGLTGCFGPPPEPGWIYGWVVYDDATKGLSGSKDAKPKFMVVRSTKGLKGYAPLPGAVVTAGGVTDVTDSDGYFMLSPLSPRYYTVYITHERYMPVTIPNVYVYSGRGTSIGEPRAGAFYYLFIGISDYYPSGQENDYDLYYADKDAEALQKSLYVTNYYAGEGSRILLNSQATKAGIRAAIQAIAGSMTDQDYFVMTFSGHGGSYSLVEPPPTGQDPPDEFIIPYDYFPSEAPEYLISDDELTGWVAQISGKNKIFIFDSCYSGGMYKFPPKLAAKGMKPGFSALARDLNKAGYIVITASDDNESSLEYPSLEHGVFTYFFCQGIDSRQADISPQDGKITALEAFNYAKPRVIDYVKLNPPPGDGQTPQIWLGRSDVPVYRVPPTP